MSDRDMSAKAMKIAVEIQKLAGRALENPKDEKALQLLHKDSLLLDSKGYFAPGEGFKRRVNLNIGVQETPRRILEESKVHKKDPRKIDPRHNWKVITFCL